MGRSIVIGAALIAAAILARSAWTQSTTSGFATAVVVATCGTAPYSSGQWTYAAGTQAPLTINTGGSLCVNQ